MKPIEMFIGILFSLGGLVILCIAGGKHRAVILRRRRTTAQAEARVERRTQVYIPKPGQKTVPYFVYTFSAGGGRRQAVFAGKQSWKAGDAVTVFYDPKDPETIFIPQAQPWAQIAALYWIGAVWALAPAVSIVLTILGIL